MTGLLMGQKWDGRLGTRMTTFSPRQDGSSPTHLSRTCIHLQVMGLWPHYALLNHSCSPNTVTYSHLSMLVTRASRSNIGKGAELSTNYIGDLLLS